MTQNKSLTTKEVSTIRKAKYKKLRGLVKQKRIFNKISRFFKK